MDQVVEQAPAEPQSLIISGLFTVAVIVSSGSLPARGVRCLDAMAQPPWHLHRCWAE